MGKAFLMIVLLGCFAFLGLFLLFTIGALPRSMTNAIYKLEQELHLGGNSSVPYLEKFEGKWDVVLQYSGQTDASVCTTREGTVTVHNGVMTGLIGVFGNTQSVQASVAETGNVQGQLLLGQNSGALTGTLTGASGTGTWQDTFDCQGTAVFTKLDPVVDPVAGTLSLFTGNVVITHADGSPHPSLDLNLYGGDQVQVPTDGTATILLGSNFEKVIIPPGTTYTVPDPTN